MSKNWKKLSDDRKLAIELGTCIVIVIIAGILWIFDIGNTTVVRNNFFLIVAFLLFSVIACVCAICLVGCIVAFLFFSVIDYIDKKRKEKIDKENAVKIKKLPNEFTEVGLKDVSTLLTYISDENIHCKAMLDENGKVILQIKGSIEINIGTTDYTWILNHFDIE